MRAADLGAAPGGWSWVLSRHGIQVNAIDNGPMADSAMATGLISHQRADGFTWQPAKALDWMVCDMVEQPRRVAARMGEWVANGWCRSEEWRVGRERGSTGRSRGWRENKKKNKVQTIDR